MPNTSKAFAELIKHLASQNRHIKTLKSTLDALIKKRQTKSYFSQLASGYGETSWWKKALLSLIFLPSTGAVIYFSGASLLMMLPIAGLYFLSAFFLSNHYNKDHDLQTETLKILENILTESTNALSDVHHRLNKATEAIETIYHAQKAEHLELKQQIKRIEKNNQAYEKIMARLNPLIQALTTEGHASHEKTQAFLALFDQTHEALKSELNRITQTLGPKIDQSIASATQSQLDASKLKTQFQKNMLHMNTFVSTLDTLLCQLEKKPDKHEEKQTAAHHQTKQLLHESEDAINHAMHFIRQSKQNLPMMPSITSSSENAAGLTP